MDLDEVLIANPYLKVGALTGDQHKELIESLEFLYSVEQDGVANINIVLPINDDDRVIYTLVSMAENGCQDTIIIKNDHGVNYWDPREEGYYSGPDVADTWSKPESLMSGQFCGYVLEDANPPHASIAWSMDSGRHALEAFIRSDECDPKDFVVQMAKWDPPRSHEERYAASEQIISHTIRELPEERRIEFLVEEIFKLGGDPANPRFFEKEKDRAFEAIKPKLVSDATKVIGKGCRTDSQPCDWVTIETPRGVVAIKQYMEGPGLASETSVWSHHWIEDEGASQYSEDMGYFLELNASEISEPIGFRYCTEL